MPPYYVKFAALLVFAALAGCAEDHGAKPDHGASDAVGAAHDSASCGRASVGSSTMCLQPPEGSVRGEEFTCKSENIQVEGTVVDVDGCTECTAATFALVQVDKVLTHCNRTGAFPSIAAGDVVSSDHAEGLTTGQALRLSCWVVYTCADGCTGSPATSTRVCREAYFGCAPRCSAQTTRRSSAPR